MHAIRGVFSACGYEEIETPTFEYFDVFGREIGTTPSRDLYKFFDREGETLVLRPDFTPSVARAVSMYFGREPRPLRLYYEGNTFVNEAEYRGRMKETTQMGVERIGENSAEADAEVIALVIDSLREAGLDEFQVSIGEVEFFKSLTKDAELSDEERERVRALISRKNFFGVEEAMDEMSLSPSEKEAFTHLPQLFGGTEVLDMAKRYAFTEEAKDAILRLRAISDLLADKGMEKYISFDFGMLSKYRYYTGIIFSAFTYGSGEPVAKGGRYDSLMQAFGGDDPAVGAGIYVTGLLDALRVRNKDYE